MRAAVAIVLHGPKSRADLLRRYPSVAEKVACIEHGNYEHLITRSTRASARESLVIPPEEVVYAFVGNVRRRKGIELFIEALADCRGAGARGIAFIVGAVDDSHYLADLKALASRRAVDAFVRWYVCRGPVPQAQLDLIVSSADQVVLPFLGASQSGSVIYAMTHGRCVVTTALGELPRTLRDRGILVEPGSHTSLAAAMRLAASEPDHCAQLGERARQYAVTELSWDRVGAQTRLLYDRAVRGIVG
jgi:glycosyltransferase involved in cell wall biosynthesis